VNGELAQHFALATFATAQLRDRSAAAAVLADSHSVLQFVAAITFDDLPDIDSWVRHLAATKVDRVWLAVPSLDPRNEHDTLAPHIGAAFVGGLRAALLTAGSPGTKLWKARWQLGNRRASGSRIWTVDYRSRPVTFEPQRPDPEEAAQTLDQALQQAQEFSVRHDLKPWDGVFARARRIGSGGDGQAAYQSDLFPEAWGRADCRRLADMAQAAWVFGGMGSWNDLGFAHADLQAEYERISKRLFGAILRACVAAANADP
jgi:hypothetical protein